MGQTYVLEVELTSINCGSCGGVYALNERFRRDCEEKGRTWTCPYCKTGWGYKEGENARLKKELEAEKTRVQAEKARHDQTKASLRETERRRRAAKGVATRLKNRINAGTCPCCDRAFLDVRQHMAEAHPDFITADDADEKPESEVSGAQ